MRNNSPLLKNKVLKTILSAIIVLSIWEIAALLINDAYFLPDILQTSKALIKIISSRSFFEVVFTSVYRVFSGLFYGIAAGTVLAGICYKFDIVIVTRILSNRRKLFVIAGTCKNNVRAINFVFAKLF
jgi:ABC-type nitrate/sulfonate/bicarbonate transport system permease component